MQYHSIKHGALKPLFRILFQYVFVSCLEFPTFCHSFSYYLLHRQREQINV